MKNTLKWCWQIFANYPAMALLIGFFVFIAIVASLTIVNKDTFYATTLGALLALISAAILYRISLYLDNKEKDRIKQENTKFIYELYKMEIATNIEHINDMIEKKWIPFYRLHMHARNRLWGQLADYSKDINLLKKINALYGEYQLINNKIDIMNEVRLQGYKRSFEELSGVPTPEDVKGLKQEMESQLNGCIGLGKNANTIAKECLEMINNKINEAVSST